MTANVPLAARLRAGYVQRWHACPEMAGSECVDAHAARVCKIILYLWPDTGPELLVAALIHDDGELGLGDVSGPAKRRHPALGAVLDTVEAENRALLGLPDPELIDHEHLQLDLADKLAGLMHMRQVRPDLTDNADWRADIAALQGKLSAAQDRFPGVFERMAAVVNAELPIPAFCGHVAVPMDTDRGPT